MMKKVTRDFPTLLACAMIADDHGEFAEFFDRLSEPECTVFTEGFSAIVFEMLKAGLSAEPQRRRVRLAHRSQPNYLGMLNHPPQVMALM